MNCRMIYFLSSNGGAIASGAPTTEWNSNNFRGTNVPIHLRKCFVLLLTLGIAHGAQAAPGYSPLEENVGAYVEQRKLPALTVQIVDQNGPVWTAGYGAGEKLSVGSIDGSTVYRVGSVSKLFTDIALMQLVEEGLVDLSAPVATYLPSFAPKNPFNKDITVEALMSHRSGLVREPPVGNYFDATQPSIKQTVDSLNATTLVYEPGTKVQYSNAALTVVGRIVEVMRGQAFDDVVQERLLTPLGIGGSFRPSAALLAKMPDGLMQRYHGPHFPAPTFTLGMSPAGNLYASMDDLGKFSVALINRGKTSSGRIVEAQTLDRMWMPAGNVVSARNRQFGIGFALEEFEGELAVSHGGALYGFSTQLKILPQSGLGVVVSTNLDFANGAVNRIADHALRYALALKHGTPAPVLEVTRPVSAQQAKALESRYESASGIVEIRQRMGKLYFERAGGLALELMQSENGIVVDGLLAFDDQVTISPEKIDAFGEVYTRLPDSKPTYDIDALKPYFGEYGEDHNILFIGEKYGKLHVLIEWGTEYPLDQVEADTFRFPPYGLYPNEELKFRRSARTGQITAADLGGILFQRRAEKGVSGGVFKIEPQRPVGDLIADALAAEPPVEKGQFVDSDLVDITRFADNIKLDIRYASSDNFLGTPVYSQPKAFLQRRAAEALGRVSRRLAEQGYGLLVHDAYRPWYVTKVFWDATPEDKKIFVANPADGSRHNRGAAVDLTLYDLTTGQAIEMVGLYDEMTERSYPHYPGGSSLQRWHRDLLRREMEREGFAVYEFEWWHFDFDGWQQFPIGNETFEELLSKK